MQISTEEEPPQHFESLSALCVQSAGVVNVSAFPSTKLGEVIESCAWSWKAYFVEGLSPEMGMLTVAESEILASVNSRAVVKALGLDAGPHTNW